MKYKAYEEKAGTWFVNTVKIKGTQRGRRFATEYEAKEYALLESHDYYREQMNKSWRELSKLVPEENKNDMDEIKLTGSDHYINQSDLMC